MSGQEGFDVFVSHHGEDTKRGFSVWLWESLERRRFSCFFDEYSLQRGVNNWATIKEALSKCKVAVVVLSRRFFTSKYCLRELHMCRTQAKQVVPIFFDIRPDECRPDSLASNVPGLPWDSHDGNWEGFGWEEDVQWIKSIVGLRLEALDNFQNRCIHLTILDVARLLGRPAVDIVNEVDLTPFHRNASFVGRGDELERLEKLLGEYGKALVTGMGGMGKTQLLLEYVNRYKGLYAKILWIDGTVQRRLASFLGLAKHVGVELEKEGADAEAENIGRVKDALERAEAAYLLVMDNVDEEEGLWDMLPRHGLCQVLVSTQLNKLSDMPGIELLVLDERDALKLLVGDQRALLPEMEGELLKLANRLGRLTHALAVSSRILAEKVSPQGLVLLLDQHGAEVFKGKRADPKYNISPDLVKLFDVSMGLILGSRDPGRKLAKAMVQVGGWFARAEIPFSLLEDAAARMSPEFHNQGGEEAFGLLVRYSLGNHTKAGGHVLFHELVQDYGRILGGQDAGKAVVSALSEKGKPEAKSAVHYQNAYDLTILGTEPWIIHLEKDGWQSMVQRIGIPLVYHYTGAGFDLTRGRTLVHTFPEDGNQTLLAEVLACRGQVLWKSGEFDAAYEQYELAFRILERACLHEGVSCDKCLKSPIEGPRYKSLDQDDYDLCADCVREHGTESERFILVEHPHVAILLDHMAGLLESQGKYKQALTLCEKSLRILEEKGLGPNHPIVAMRLDNMASVLWRQGKYEEAMPLCTTDLRIKTEALGPDHPLVVNVLNTMACLLESQGKYKEALALHERCLRIQEKALGPDHPNVAMSLNSMATLLRRQGKYEEALPRYERALHIQEQVLGPDHPDVALLLNNKATLLESQGKYEEALPLFEQSRAIWEKALGLDHSNVATSLNNTASLLQRQGKYEEALPLFEKSRAIWEIALGPDHPDVAILLNNMAVILRKQDKYEEALPLFKKSRAILEKVLEPDHPAVALPLNNMAILLESKGKYEEALPLYKESLRIQEKALGPDHPDMAIILRNLAILLRDQGKYEEALPLYERALRIQEKALGPEHPEVATMLNDMACVMENLDRFWEAMPLYERARRICHDRPGR